MLPMLVFGASCQTTAAEREPCVVPAQSRSMMTEARVLYGDSGLTVRVVDAAVRPLRDVQLVLEPARLHGVTDSLGTFRFDEAPRGRHELRVSSLGFLGVTDSITYSEFGTDVVVVLVQRLWGLYGCIRSAA